MIRFNRGGIDDVEGKLAEALEKWAATKSPADQAEVMRLYEAHSGYRAGCGACIAGRKLFMDGLNAMLSGDSEQAAAKMGGAFKSARFKFDVLKAKLGW
jgi:predicted Zn-dependent protease